MIGVYLDCRLDEEGRRRLIYAGHILVFSPRPSTLALCEIARAALDEAFAPYAPQQAQFALPPASFHSAVLELRRSFVRRADLNAHVRQALTDFGCDPRLTFLHFLFLRTSTAAGLEAQPGGPYLSAPHRDNWVSAPPCQITWWIPLYDIDHESCLAFYPRHWVTPISNTSASYRYPTPAAPARAPNPTVDGSLDPDSELRLVCPAGGAILFSAAHLHGTVPNSSGRTRFSMDFRTAHLHDLHTRRGAPNLDAACTGTSLPDFKRLDDLSPVPEYLLELYGRSN
jgi:hypothetical protein